MIGPARSAAAVLTLLAVSAAPLAAHSGPPFPIVTNRVAGPYQVSIWTDPDTTDDGSPGGQFWVMLRPAASGTALPSRTRVSISVSPLDRAAAIETAAARPLDGDASRQFAAVVMDHEGRFAVRVEIAGPLGRAEVLAEAEATYDERPPPIMLAVYLVPFLLVGALWVKLLLRRRRAGTSAS